MKRKIIPFDAKMAKDIQAGEIKGKIRTKGGESARIICYDKIDISPIVALILDSKTNSEYCYNYCENGEFRYREDSHLDLVIEVPDNEPQFKPFDKVLMRSPSSGYVCWYPHFYSRYIPNAEDKKPYVALDGFGYEQCIPYEGNEHLVGTTDKPKEE